MVMSGQFQEELKIGSDSDKDATTFDSFLVGVYDQISGEMRLYVADINGSGRR